MNQRVPREAAGITQRIAVPLPDREYSIKVGRDLLTGIGSDMVSLGLGGRVLLVTNHTVAQWYLEPIRQSMTQAGLAVHEVLVPDGEEYKSLAQAETIFTRAAAARLDREDTVAALGGGVIGDLAGFIAATYLRGLSFVQIPTTLLAQIDSSIGGKVAVNLPAGKNLVGAFHQPRLVTADIDTLKTLPARELRAGLIEMLKHGLLDADYFAWYERNLPGLLALEPAVLIEGISWSCRVKAAVVAADERERGLRSLLNLGHTVGHALEVTAGYGTWRHGEAVGLGLIAASRLAVRSAMITTAELERIETAVRGTLGHLPTFSKNEIDALMAAMLLDKKTVADKLRFVLPRGIGRAEVVTDIDSAVVREELAVLAAPEVAGL